MMPLPPTRTKQTPTNPQTTDQTMRRPLILTILTLILLAWPASGVRAQVLEGLPKVAEGIGVDQKTGATLPFYLDFDDEKNNRVFVEDLFDGKIPVLL